MCGLECAAVLVLCFTYRYVACTGTNFCLRVHPLAECGWFPDYSITEDYTLVRLAVKPVIRF